MVSNSCKLGAPMFGILVVHPKYVFTAGSCLELWGVDSVCVCVCVCTLSKSLNMMQF